MKKVRVFTSLAVTVTVISLALPGLAHSQAKKLTALASITIIQDIAKNVAGDKINVDYLVPTDGDVHQFQPAPADIKIPTST